MRYKIFPPIYHKRGDMWTVTASKENKEEDRENKKDRELFRIYYAYGDEEDIDKKLYAYVKEKHPNAKEEQ